MVFSDLGHMLGMGNMLQEWDWVEWRVKVGVFKNRVSYSFLFTS